MPHPEQPPAPESLETPGTPQAPGAPETPPDKTPKKDHGGLLDGLSLFAQLGFTMAACIFVGFFIGRTLDGWLGTGPWLLLLFCLLGAGAAIKTIFDSVKH